MHFKISEKESFVSPILLTEVSIEIESNSITLISIIDNPRQGRRSEGFRDMCDNYVYVTCLVSWCYLCVSEIRENPIRVNQPYFYLFHNFWIDCAFSPTLLENYGNCNHYNVQQSLQQYCSGIVRTNGQSFRITYPQGSDNFYCG